MTMVLALRLVHGGFVCLSVLSQRVVSAGQSSSQGPCCSCCNACDGKSSAGVCEVDKLCMRACMHGVRTYGTCPVRQGQQLLQALQHTTFTCMLTCGRSVDSVHLADGRKLNEHADHHSLIAVAPIAVVAAQCPTIGHAKDTYCRLWPSATGKACVLSLTHVSLIPTPFPLVEKQKAAGPRCNGQCGLAMGKSGGQGRALTFCDLPES